MKIISQAEEEDHYQAVIKGGTRWGLGGVTGGLTGAWIANRYWSGFRNLTIPLKAFAITSIATFSLIVGADRASRQYEESQFNQTSDARWKDQELEHQLGLDDGLNQDARHRSDRFQSLTRRDKMIEYLKEKQYEIVLGGWAASMIGSFGLVAAQPMPFTQKLVQARMYAQSLTVAMILASAGLASMKTSASNDSASQESRRDSAMYKFRKGSPHELRQRELRDEKMRETS